MLRVAGLGGRPASVKPAAHTSCEPSTATALSATFHEARPLFIGRAARGARSSAPTQRF
ncbi:hypothetical protein HCDSEM_034 [Candidatus Hodgkinia cicadicola Dsem]|nr:hypothetical protein HCDSEM_034 [Candidatus Hodgkinia cicadicola Dsem]